MGLIGATSKVLTRARQVSNYLRHLEVKMRSQRRHPNRPAVAVVARIVDVLQIEGAEHATPYMRGVIDLHNFFASVIQRAITEQKAQPSESQVFAVIG